MSEPEESNLDLDELDLGGEDIAIESPGAPAAEPRIGEITGELTDEEDWDDQRVTNIDGLFDTSGDEFTPDDQSGS